MGASLLPSEAAGPYLCSSDSCIARSAGEITEVAGSQGNEGGAGAPPPRSFLAAEGASDGGARELPPPSLNSDEREASSAVAVMRRIAADASVFTATAAAAKSSCSFDARLGGGFTTEAELDVSPRARRTASSLSFQFSSPMPWSHAYFGGRRPSDIIIASP